MREREAPVIIYESINGAKWDCETRDEKRVRRKCANGGGRGRRGQEGTEGDVERDPPPDVVQTHSSYSWNEKPVC